MNGVKMAPFGFFGFLSSLSTGSSVGGCPTSAVTRELRNFGNATLFIFRPSKCRALVPKLAWLARRYCACAADARVLRMRSQCGSNVWTAVVITMNILTCLIFSDQIFREERGVKDSYWWWKIMCWSLWKMWEKFFIKKLTKHHVLHHA